MRMNYQGQATEQVLIQLFHGFVEAGLHGRFEEALDLIVEPYTGVGMGEQGIVHNKEEAGQVLLDGYISAEGTVIDYEVKDLTINLLGEGAAVLVGEVIVINTPPGKEPIRSGMMQTVGMRLDGERWHIAFTHSSPTILTAESVEAYPIRFMDKTISALRADLLAETTLYRDSLTGILNREGIDRHAAELMQDYNPKHNTALFMIDLDDFKQINDRLGHQTGDIVLQQVALALRKTFRETDAVGRIGGDEFMILLSGDFSAKFLEKKADELLNSMRLRMGDTQEVPVSISIGIAYGRARATFEKLYRIADIALYTAKRAGKCRYHLINADTNTQRSYSGAGTTLLSLQTLLDYTDGKETIQSKTPYEALLENLPGGVVMFEFTDTTIKVTHCNDWFSRLLGYSEEEVAARQAENPLYFVYPDDLPQVTQAAQLTWDGADSNHVTYRVVHKDGSLSYMSQVTSVTERRRGSVIVYGIVTDMDEVMRLKQEVEDARKELEAYL